MEYKNWKGPKEQQMRVRNDPERESSLSNNSLTSAFNAISELCIWVVKVNDEYKELCICEQLTTAFSFDRTVYKEVWNILHIMFAQH